MKDTLIRIYYYFDESSNGKGGSVRSVRIRIETPQDTEADFNEVAGTHSVTGAIGTFFLMNSFLCLI